MIYLNSFAINLHIYMHVCVAFSFKNLPEYFVSFKMLQLHAAVCSRNNLDFSKNYEKIILCNPTKWQVWKANTGRYFSMLLNANIGSKLHKSC